MAVNRLSTEPSGRDMDDFQPPRPAQPPAGFAVCPALLMQPDFQSRCQEIYRLAYEKARAEVFRAKLERRFFSNWN